MHVSCPLIYNNLSKEKKRPQTLWPKLLIFFLPFNLLAAKTFLPPAVLILFLKP